MLICDVTFLGLPQVSRLAQDAIIEVKLQQMLITEADSFASEH